MIMIKRILTVLLLAAVLVCGCAAAADEGYGTLVVTVLDQTGESLANAVVTINSQDNTIMKSLNTPSDGKVPFETLPAGVYTIKTTKPGYINDVRTKEVVKDGTVPETVRLQIESPIMIEVISADSKKPIENAEVTVNGKLYTTNKDGRADVVMTKNGYNTLKVSANSYVDYLDEARYVSESDTAFQVPLTLARVTPILQVYTSDTKPVLGAIVSIDGKQVAISDSYGNAQMPTYTASVAHDMVVTCSGFAPYTQEIIFTPDKTNYIVTLEYADTPLTVIVKDEDKRLADAIVYFDGINVGKTDANGLFVTAVNPGRTIEVSASLEGYTGKPVTCTIEGITENTVTVEMTENIPTTMIALVALGGILVLLIVILIIVWRRRGRREAANKQSYPPTQRRDYL